MTTIPVVSQRKDDEEKAIRKLVDLADPVLDRAAKVIFVRHADVLLTESLTYILPAMWADRESNTILTPFQKDIHRLAEPAIAEAIDILQMEELDKAQELVLRYILGSMLAMKVMHMTKQCREKLVSWGEAWNTKTEILEIFIPPERR